jgi:protein-tyrosine kinase
MSKIAKALERAKTSLGEFSPTPSSRVTEVKDFHLVPRNIPEPLVYTETRVVRPTYDFLEENRVVTFFNDSARLNDYNLLRTQMLKRLKDPSNNTIMITSVNQGEGKTVTAINLALSIAREVQKTVLLVDMNLRKPKVHEYLGLGRATGLSDYLLKDTPIPELLVNPGLDKIVVLPAGEPIQDSAEILGSGKVKDLVREMKTRYKNRYVIFDCPHILNMPDAIVFSSLVDGVILVVEAGKTPREEIMRAQSLLEGSNLLGIVMNKTRYA